MRKLLTPILLLSTTQAFASDNEPDWRSRITQNQDGTFTFVSGRKAQSIQIKGQSAETSVDRELLVRKVIEANDANLVFLFGPGIDENEQQRLIQLQASEKWDLGKYVTLDEYTLLITGDSTVGLKNDQRKEMRFEIHRKSAEARPFREKQPIKVAAPKVPAVEEKTAISKPKVAKVPHEDEVPSTPPRTESVTVTQGGHTFNFTFVGEITEEKQQLLMDTYVDNTLARVKNPSLPLFAKNSPLLEYGFSEQSQMRPGTYDVNKGIMIPGKIIYNITLTKNK